MPEQWHARAPHQGSTTDIREWWLGFSDSVLPQLIEAAEHDSPSLVQAWAAIEKSRANAVTARANALPSVSGNASLSRARQQSAGAGSNVQTSRSGGLDASWEIDLFGKLSHSQQAASARLSARQDDWHDARISLAAEVADNYVQYRACQLLVATYQEEEDSRQHTVEVTHASVTAGFTAPADEALARASLASTQATLTSQQADCDLQVKSLVALTGMDEAALRRMLDSSPPALIQPEGMAIASVPAQVIQQRPDIASLEREAAAAGAEVGVARAEMLPSLSLSGAISIASSNLASAATSWSFGPALSLPLIDWGKRKANVDISLANYDSAIAQWRQGVRSAVKEVEQALVNLDATEKRMQQQKTASEQYARYLLAATEDWRAGRINLLSLQDARRSSLSADVQYITIQRDRLRSWIALYKALGGGWQAGDSVVKPALASNAQRLEK